MGVLLVTGPLQLFSKPPARPALSLPVLDRALSPPRSGVGAAAPPLYTTVRCGLNPCREGLGGPAPASCSWLLSDPGMPGPRAASPPLPSRAPPFSACCRLERRCAPPACTCSAPAAPGLRRSGCRKRGAGGRRGPAAGAATAAAAQSTPANSATPSSRTPADPATMSFMDIKAAAGRFDGVTRPYTEQDVQRLRGSVKVEHTLAQRGAEKLWELLKTEPYVHALGALSGNQVGQRATGHRLGGGLECSPHGVCRHM